MASIHPSRENLVPRDRGSSDGADGGRERELRQRLEQARAARSQAHEEREGERSYARNDGRRDSPTYDPYEGHQTSRGAHFDGQREGGGTDGRRGFYHGARDYFEDRRGIPSSASWGKRSAANERAPYNAMGSDHGYLESRQEQRRQSSFSIWPPSPTSPFRPEEEDAAKKRKSKSDSRHKSRSDRRDRSSRHRSRRREDSEEPDREDEEERRHRHRRRRREQSREREKRRRSSSAMQSESEDEDDRRRRKRRERETDRERDRYGEYGKSRSDNRHERRRHRSDRREGSEHGEEGHDAPSRNEEQVAQGVVNTDVELSSRALIDGVDKSSDGKEREQASSSARKIGPQLPVQNTGEHSKVAGPDSRGYGKALLPGEGTAMANFVQEGQRIPRRGEIGLSSDQIEAYEKAGFVMSGSRHQRMNAVRMRKENQIYSAEEQRAMLKLIAEEKQKKEATLIEQFKDLVDSID